MVDSCKQVGICLSMREQNEHEIAGVDTRNACLRKGAIV
jgi:hypothetical protein